MVFCKGNTNSVNRIMEALQYYSKVTGLIANMDKSSMIVAEIDDNVK